MKLLKPAWVSHDGKPILSVDIHPDGSRFATGGQGDSSGKIVIWNMEPVREEALENDLNVPKILCQMDNHLACVNCVRWSGDGKYLASAGDDKLIMIWQSSRQPGTSSSFGSGGNAESWRVFSTLRGHSGDVLSVAWSSHNAWLASCSMDNTIIVWNSLKFPEQIAVLRGHTGMIKGITWDPVGKYLASQSDDKTVRIWRTYDWQLDACIKEPYAECGGTTHVLRLDWSPDGEYLVSAHAMNNSGPTAQIIDRNGWRTNMDFVGHRKAVTCVRFSSRIMEKVKPNGAKSKEYVVCAIGSKDRSISIWGTCWKRPIIVLHELFVKSIFDITWSGNGLEMLSCSWDGTVAYFGFTADELGTPMSYQEKVALHKKLYGKSVLVKDSNPSNIIIESMEIFEAQEDLKINPPSCPNMNGNKVIQKLDPVEMDIDPQKSDLSMSTSSPTKVMNRQIETRTIDGKRKITPIFLAPQPDFGGVPTPYTSFQHQPTPQFSSSTETSTIIVEKKDEILSSVPPPRHRENSVSQSEVVQFTKHQEETGPPVTSALPTSQTSNHLNDHFQSSVATAVAPMHVENNSVAVSHHEINNTIVTIKPATTTITTTVSTPSVYERSLVMDGTDELRKKKDGRGRPRKDRMSEGMARIQNQVNTPIVPRTTPSSSLAQASNPQEYTPTFSLPPLSTIPNPCTLLIPKDNRDDYAYILECRNRVTSSSSIIPSRVRCFKAGSILWENLLSSTVIAALGSNDMCAVISDENIVHAYSTSTGRLLFPFTKLHGPPAVFQLTAFFIMIATTTGKLSIWDVSKLKCIVKNESLELIFGGEDTTIMKTFITEQGVPILSLSNGKAYSYMTDMECWVLLSSASDVVATIAEKQLFPRNDNGYLANISHRAKPADQAMKLFQSDHATRVLASVTNYETQLAASLALKSPYDFKKSLMAYAKFLMRHDKCYGAEKKLRTICQELLNPVLSGAFGTKPNNATTLGHDNLELLQEILNAMKIHAVWQRLHNEFQSQINDLTDLS